MTGPQHNHHERVPGCYRCDLSRDAVTGQGQTPLDPAAIMAWHRPQHRLGGAPCYQCYDEHRSTQPWPCKPYRLAELLVVKETDLEESRANARHLARRLIRGMEVTANIDVLIEYEKEAFRQGNRETEDAVGPLMQVRNHLRDALAVEHTDDDHNEGADNA